MKRNLEKEIDELKKRLDKLESERMYFYPVYPQYQPNPIYQPVYPTFPNYPVVTNQY